MDTGFQNWGENQPSHTEYVLHYFVLVVLTKYFQLTNYHCIHFYAPNLFKEIYNRVCKLEIC